MKRILLLALCTSICGFFLTGCNKDPLLSSNGVEIYLLKSFQTLDNSQKINEKSVVLESKPLVNYSDIIFYNTNQYFFKISDRAVDAINNVNHSVKGVAFALTAGGRIVYTGYFWPMFSSASCNWITIDPFMASVTKELRVKLGYPGDWEGVEDRRNDERLISILKRDNKLK